MLRAHPEVSHVWEISHDGSFTGPRIALLGAVHGNERAGLAVIDALRADAGPLAARMRQGTLVLVHGNPEATAEGTRHTRGGADLNRLFSFEWLESLAPEAYTPEHHRALALRGIVTESDAILDLHSASQPTIPFAICDGTPAGVALARRLGCAVTWGWDGPGMLMRHVAIGPLVARGRPAVSVECGRHADRETFDHAHRIAARFLTAVGLLEGEAPAADAPGYRLFARVVKPTMDFELARDFATFDVLAAGDVLGRGEGVVISVEQEAVLVLPTPRAERGEDLVYLARRED